MWPLPIHPPKGAYVPAVLVANLPFGKLVRRFDSPNIARGVRSLSGRHAELRAVRAPGAELRAVPRSPSACFLAQNCAPKGADLALSGRELCHHPQIPHPVIGTTPVNARSPTSSVITSRPKLPPRQLLYARRHPTAPKVPSEGTHAKGSRCQPQTHQDSTTSRKAQPASSTALAVGTPRPEARQAPKPFHGSTGALRRMWERCVIGDCWCRFTTPSGTQRSPNRV